MPEKIKGITVEIGGDTTPLGKAIDGINKKSKALQSELRGVNTLLKGDPNSSVLQAQKQELVGKSVEETRKKLELLKSKQAEVTAAFEKYSLVSHKIEELKGKISSTSEKLKELKLKQDEAKAAFDKGEISEQQYKEIENQVKETKEALTSLKAEQNELSKGTVNAEQYRDFQREIVKTETDLKSLQVEQKKANALKFDSVIKSTQTLGNNITKVGNKLKTVSTISGGILALSVKNASEYETAVAKASTLTDKTVLSNEKLSSGMLKISSDLNMANTDIAEATYQALSASVETGNALEFTASAAKLAKAGFTETATSVDVLTTIQNAYNLSADKTNQLADMLVNTQNKGKTTVGQLAESMGKVIPTAETLGVSIGQLCTGYAEMTKRGINTANATTYMNSLFDEFGKSSTELYKITKQVTGKSFKELMSEGKSVGDVLGSLSDYAKANNKNFNDFFSKSNSRKAALSLLKVGADGFNESLKDMENCTGVVDQALEDLQNPTSKAKKALNELKNTSVEFGAQILSDAEPLIDGFGEKIEDLSDWWGDLNSNQKDAVVKIAAIIAVGSPALTLLGKATTGISQYVSGLKGAILSITAKTTATAADTVATTSATVATGALGVAMKALPLIGIASMIIGVASAFIEFNSEASETESQIEDLNTEIEENRKAWADLKQQNEDNRDSEIAKIENTKNLTKELDTLVGKNREVKKSDQERVNFILGELTEALGEEYGSLDKIVDKYGKVKTAVFDVIDAKKALVIVEAKEDLASEAYKNLPELQKTYDSALKAYSDFIGGYEKEFEKYIELRNMQNKSDDSKAEMAKLENTLSTFFASQGKHLPVSSYIEDFNGLKAAIEDATDDISENNKAIQDFEDATELYADGTKKSYQKIIDSATISQRKITDINSASISELKSAITTIDTEISQSRKNRDSAETQADKKYWKTKISTLKSEKKEYEKQLAEFSKQNFETLDGGFQIFVNNSLGTLTSQNTLNRFQNSGLTLGRNLSIGISSANTVNAANKVVEKTSDAIKTEENKTKMQKSGTFLTIGVATGSVSDSALGQVASSGKTVFNAFKTSLEKEADINSPAKNMAPDGMYLVQGVVGGVDAEVEKQIPNLKKKARAIMSAFTSDVPEEYNVINLGANFHSAVEHTFSAKAQTQSTLTAVDNLSRKMDELIAKTPMGLYLDGEILVGGTVSKTDRALGSRQVFSDRGLPST